MNKFLKNNIYLRKSLYALAVVIISIVFYRFTENVKIASFIPIIITVLTPFIYGGIMAYLLNIGTRSIEKRILSHIKHFKGNDVRTKRKKRIVSIALTLIILIGAIIAMVAYIIPEIMMSAQNIINIAIGFDYSGMKKWVDNFLIQHNIVLGSEAYNSLINSINNIIETITDWVKYLPNMAWSIISHTMSIASSLVDVVMGLIIALYLLMDKEKVINFGIMVTKSLLPEKHSELIIENIKIINDTFNSFFTGKTLDSLIIGIIFFIGAVILNIPYPLLFAIIIAVTNMIPYFGPFIGAVPVTILTVLVSPIKGIWVLLFIIVLQQFDGMILGPKILGDSIGMKPIGVIFAIIVGGAVAGPFGMFFGVPVFACLFRLLFKFIDRVYTEKYIKKEAEDIAESEES